MEGVPPGEQTTNTVGGHARVRQQIGNVGTYVRKVVHDNSTNYQYASESPKDMFDAACEYLAAGASIKAAGLIEDAQARGHRSTEVAYYWRLSILAGRPFDHLSPRELSKLESARSMAARFDSDDWTEASDLIEDLLKCFTTQVQSRWGYDGDRYENVMSRYQRLPEARRMELGRHLAPLFSGGLQDRLDHERRRQIEANRMGNGRRHRVPKFFEPEPAEPLQRIARSPEIGASHWLALVLGATACGYGAILAISHAARVSLPRAIIFGVLLIVGSFVVAVLAPGILGLRAAERHRDRWAVATEDLGAWMVRSSKIDDLISKYFLEFAPKDPAEQARCLTALDAELGRLSDNLNRPSGSIDQGSGGAEEIGWLIRWHLEGLLDAWRSGTFDQPALDRIGSVRRALLWLGGATMLLSTIELLSVFARWTFGASGVVVAVIFLLAGGSATLLFASAIYTERRRYIEELNYNARLFPREKAAWDRERHRLADRPDDFEMAEWLDYDKDHVRLSAMKQWGLGNWDIVAHVVLTEPAPDSESARVRNGPRRYSCYIVRLFLLTNNGVRHLDVHIDFSSGAENKQQRHAFRYDAIASAQIEEPTVRRGGRRQVVSVDGDPRGAGSQPIRRQKLQLTLVNGENVEINADYDRLMTDEDRDDKEALLILEMETSGAVSTLRTLETVAGEGREWLRRERERADHVAAEYRQVNENPSGAGAGNGWRREEPREDHAAAGERVFFTSAEADTGRSDS